jgi:hypothetical protein
MKVFAARVGVTIILLVIMQASPFGDGPMMSKVVSILAFIAVFAAADFLISKYLKSD